MSDGKISEEVRNGLKDMFGYVPQPYEQHVIWREDCLLVIHPDNLPRVYRRWGKGDYYELLPVPFGK